MAFSICVLFDSRLKRAHGLLPNFVEVGAQAGDAFRVELVEAAGSRLRICNQARMFEDA